MGTKKMGLPQYPIHRAFDVSFKCRMVMIVYGGYTSPEASTGKLAGLGELETVGIIITS